MILFPAIDLKDGQAVRLYRGDFSTAHQVADNPLAVARTFYQAGARHIHMVDLDGARSGCRQNGAVVKEVVEQSGLKVELGGGIRSMSDLEELFSLGVWRCVIGSAAVSDREFVRHAVAAYGPRVAVGIDAMDGIVKTSGWEQSSGLHDLEFAKSMEALGVNTIVFTDIAADGMLSGPSFDRLKELQQAVSCQIVASGGVSSNGDLSRLRAMNLYGAIIGKAYYTGAVDLPAAIKEAGAQC